MKSYGQIVAICDIQKTGHMTVVHVSRCLIYGSENIDDGIGIVVFEQTDGGFRVFTELDIDVF